MEDCHRAFLRRYTDGEPVYDFTPGGYDRCWEWRGPGDPNDPEDDVSDWCSCDRDSETWKDPKTGEVYWVPAVHKRNLRPMKGRPPYRVCPCPCMNCSGAWWPYCSAKCRTARRRYGLNYVWMPSVGNFWLARPGMIECRMTRRVWSADPFTKTDDLLRGPLDEYYRAKVRAD